MVTKRRRFTTKELLDIVVRSSGHCGICESLVEPGTESIDHIIPLARGGEDRAENCQLAHRRCNAKKYTRLEEESSYWQLENETAFPDKLVYQQALDTLGITFSEPPPPVEHTGGMDEMLTIAQAAAELGLTPNGLRKRLARRGGDLRALHPRMYLISRAEVERQRALEPRPRGRKKSSASAASDR